MERRRFVDALCSKWVMPGADGREQATGRWTVGSVSLHVQEAGELEMSWEFSSCWGMKLYLAKERANE